MINLTITNLISRVYPKSYLVVRLQVKKYLTYPKDGQDRLLHRNYSWLSTNALKI